MSAPFGRRRARAALFGLCLAAGSGALAAPAYAQTAPDFDTLFDQASRAPRQRILEADVERAQGLARQSRAFLNPTLSALTENFSGGSPYGGFRAAETTLQISQPLEFGGRRASRIAVGEADVVTAQARGRDGRVSFAHDLALAYGDAEIGDRRVTLAQGELEQAQEDLRVATALVNAGKEARLRSLQAETEVNAIRATIDMAQAARVGAYARLSALVGAETTYVDLAEPLLGHLEETLQAVEARPAETTAYLVARAEQQAAERRITAAQRQVIPDVTVSVGVRRFEAEGATALTAGVSLPFPLLDRNRGNIEAARAASRAADARAASALLEAQAEIRSSRALVDAADAQTLAARRTLDTAEETYRLARVAYEAGKSPLIELITARHGVSLARGVVLDAASAQLRAHASLARLQGLTITGEPVQ